MVTLITPPPKICTIIESLNRKLDCLGEKDDEFLDSLRSRNLKEFEFLNVEHPYHAYFLHGRSKIGSDHGNLMVAEKVTAISYTEKMLIKSASSKPHTTFIRNILNATTTTKRRPLSSGTHFSAAQLEPIRSWQEIDLTEPSGGASEINNTIMNDILNYKTQEVCRLPDLKNAQAEWSFEYTGKEVDRDVATDTYSVNMDLTL